MLIKILSRKIFEGDSPWESFQTFEKAATEYLKWSEANEKKKITFGKVASEYLKWSKANKKSSAADQSRYQNHLKHFDDYSMKDISPLILEKHKHDLLKKDYHQQA